LSDRPPQDFTVQATTIGDWSAMRELLLANFPQTPAAWWDAGHARLRQVPPAGTDANAPVGLLMRRGAVDVGVVMLLHSRRPGEAGQPWHVCASNFGIAPAYRRQALWLAGQATADPAKIYAAVTPIPSVARIVQRLGFRPITHQCIVGFTPGLQRGPEHRATVLWGPQALVALRDDAMAPVLHDHHRLGCLVAALQTRDRLLPLVWRSKRRLRAVRVAELLYTPSTDLVSAHVGALANGLLRRGFAMLEFEADEALVPEFPCTRLFVRRFARGNYNSAGIDHLYSELVYLHR